MEEGGLGVLLVRVNHIGWWSWWCPVWAPGDRLCFFSFFRFFLNIYLEKTKQSVEISSNWTKSCEIELLVIQFFSFFCFFVFSWTYSWIKLNIWVTFLQIEPNLVKSSFRWSTFLVFSFFRFFLDIYLEKI